jgi:hypothetical protein
MWPQYKLDNQSQWPENSTFDFRTLLDLDNFCHHNGKWSKIPYIQDFLSLCSWPSLLQSCNTVQILCASDKPPSKFNTPPDPSPKDCSLTRDLTSSVYPPPNSFSHQSSTSISSPTPASHDSDPPSYTPAGSPKYLPPYSTSTIVTIDPSHQLLRDQHWQHCPQLLLHYHSSPPHLLSILTLIPPPNNVLPIYTHSGRWQELMALSEFMCPFPWLISLSQIEKRLGSFSNDSLSYMKEFKYLTQAYAMTWHDIYVTLSSTLTSDEKERVWLTAQAHADKVHHTDLTLLVGSMAMPYDDPHWDYQDPAMLAIHYYMLTCLLAWLQTVSHRAVQFSQT